MSHGALQRISQLKEGHVRRCERASYFMIFPLTEGNPA